VPADEPRLPRLPPAALSPEARALLKSQVPSAGELWTPALKDQLAGLRSPALEAQLAGLRSPELQAMLLTPESWPLPVIEFKHRQLLERRQAIEALERQRDGIERKIASERQAARAIEAELARAGRMLDPSGATSPPTKTPSPDPSASTLAAATPAPQPVEHSPRALVGRFLDESPMRGASAAWIREAMGGTVDGSAPASDSWIGKEAARLGRKLNAPSESTIQRELNERQASVSEP
jgi:hypothetical protein